MSPDYHKLAKQYPWWPRPWRWLLKLTTLWLRLTIRADRKYSSSTTWAADHSGNWAQILKPFVGKADLRYLEVGSFEGGSLIWMLENIVTHPSTRAEAIDLFSPNYAFRFLRNLVRSGHAGRVKLRPGFSAEVLRSMKGLKFDLIYLDGSHSMADVMMDLCFSWGLLKLDGVLIVDDYLLGQDVLPTALRPQRAVDAFLLGFGECIEVLHRGNQVIFRKTKHLNHRSLIFPFGDVEFDWYKKTLTTADGRVRPATREESEMFEQRIRPIQNDPSA